MSYDIIIIGAGIAGLYCAYTYKKWNPTCKILLLEKADIGGRMGNKSFYGSQLAIGAGIGRDNKDILLKKLLKELAIPNKKFTTDTDYAPSLKSLCNVKQTFLHIKREYNKQTGSKNKTFKEFVEPLLGKEAYNIFTACAGYTDYENEDLHDTLYHYGFEDNYEEFVGIGIPWSLLLDKLVDKIGRTSIKTKSTVTKVTNQGYHYAIKVKERDSLYLSSKVVFASTVDTVIKLLGNRFPIYKEIHGQPFLRIYGKFSKASTMIMKQVMQSHILVVTGPIHKIITMDAETGVYMIAYTDNKAAISLKKYTENTERNRNALCRLLEKALEIPNGILELLSISSFYWPIGTHYYQPLSSEYDSRQAFIKRAQNPEKNLFVIGEMVALNQGWVEGALESVEHIMKKLLLR